MSLEVTKENKTLFKIKLVLSDGAVYTFKAYAGSEEEAKRKIIAQIKEAEVKLSVGK